MNATIKLDETQVTEIILSYLSERGYFVKEVRIVSGYKSDGGMRNESIPCFKRIDADIEL